MDPFPLAPLRAAFRAAATGFVPALDRAPPDTWDRLEATITGALRERPEALVRQLRLFLRVLDGAARLRYGRPLAALPADARLRLLTAFERAPVLLIRRGIWGLRTLVFMGYYTQAGVMDALGYRANPAGWSARR